MKRGLETPECTRALSCRTSVYEYWRRYEEWRVDPNTHGPTSLVHVQVQVLVCTRTRYNSILLAKPLTTLPDTSFGTSQHERFKIEIDSLRNRSNFPLLIHDYVASAL
jgi:hypothetical protein